MPIHAFVYNLDILLLLVAIVIHDIAMLYGLLLIEGTHIKVHRLVFRRFDVGCSRDISRVFFMGLAHILLLGLIIHMLIWRPLA